MGVEEAEDLRLKGEEGNILCRKEEEQEEEEEEEEEEKR